MRNIIYVKEFSKCYDCNMKGFFVYTPQGADYYTCPCCGKCDFLNYYCDNNKYDFLYNDDEYANDMRNSYIYCGSCKIIFELGCMHYSGGCTDNVYNSHFIKKWKNKITDENYEGMPQFDDAIDWFDNVNNIEVLEMYCPHNGNKCKNTIYEIKETCELRYSDN